MGLQAVVRGLEEELGITADHRRVQGPLMPCHKRELNIPGLVHDVEYVECYRSVASLWKSDETYIMTVAEPPEVHV